MAEPDRSSNANGSAAAPAGEAAPKARPSKVGNPVFRMMGKRFDFNSEILDFNKVQVCRGCASDSHHVTG